MSAPSRLPNQSAPESDSSVVPPTYRHIPMGESSGFDELDDGHGVVRPAWRPVMAELARLEPSERDQAIAEAQRAIADNDVAYRAHSDAAQPRPWQFDLMPYVLSQVDFQHLQAGLAQRTRLLEKIIADCLGEQALLKSGHLPPALIYGSNVSLPACHGALPQDGQYLDLAGYDLARGADGRWWVIRNRVSVPSGLGYSLEARLTSSHSLANVFGEFNPMRIANFFRTFNHRLERRAGAGQRPPLILAGERDDQDYFEQSLLGRYLGHPVVSSADLTVRGNRIYLRTIHGLREAGALVRRIDTEQIDPLEMRVDSGVGVPGLLQAVRSGHVTLTNWPGCELADNPGLASFLPGLCEHLLGETLLLPSLASWWCGQAREQAYVIDNLPSLNVRRLLNANTSTQTQGFWVGSQLNPAQSAGLIELIRRFPAEFVATEPMTVSNAPAFNAVGDLVPAAVTMRMFITGSPGNYVMMPGGLARAERHESGGPAPSRLPNASNKDVWVERDPTVDSTAESAMSLLAAVVDIRRSDQNLVSRTADNLFWLGSYLGRAEHAARLLRSLIRQISGESSWGQQGLAMDKLVDLLVSQAYLSAQSAEQLVSQGTRQLGASLARAIFDPGSVNSLSNILGRIAHIADAVRVRFSPDTWRLLERLSRAPQRWANEPVRGPFGAVSQLNLLIDTIAAINGQMAMNMTRADGWRFLELGNQIERLRQGARLFGRLAQAPSAVEPGALNLLLDVSDCGMTYRNRYGAVPRFVPAADLLLVDPSHPRSLRTHALIISNLLGELSDLSGIQPGKAPSSARVQSSVQPVNPIPGAPAPQALASLLVSELSNADLDALDQARDANETRVDLTDLMRTIVANTDLLAEWISARYFYHVTASRVSGSGPRNDET